MNRSEEHLNLLSIFHYIFAALMGLFSLLPIFYVLIGIMLIVEPEDMGVAGPMDSTLFGWLFVVGGGLAIMFGMTLAILSAIAGRCLAKRRRLIFCTAVAGIMCIFMPIGTVLGVITLINLTKPEVKDLFTPGRGTAVKQ